MKLRFADTLWLVLKTIPIPEFIFTDHKLILSPSELSVYVYFCFLASRPHTDCKLKASVPEIAKVTGYTARQVERALAGLRSQQLIARPEEITPRGRNGQFSVTDFELCNPRHRGRSLAKQDPSAWSTSQRVVDDRRQERSLRSALYHSSEPYLTVPEHLGTLLEPLKGTPLAIYIAVLQLANLQKKLEFEIPVKEWRTLAGIARNETFNNAIEKLEENRMLDSFPMPNRTLRVILKNPATGRDLEDEVVDATIKADTESQSSTNRPYSGEQLLKWALSVFRGEVKYGSNGEMLVRCKCGGGLRNRRARYRPTLSINTEKGKYGLYYCHSCQDGGTLLDLVMKYGEQDWLEAILKLGASRPEEPSSVS